MVWHRLAALCAVLLLAASAAFADVSDYLGQPVRRVSLESDGHPLTDARLVELVETAVGAPLAIRDVRDSLVHLFSLGEFEDVRVHADILAGGVALTYELIPLRPIGDIDFVAVPSGASEGKLRQMLVERFGANPRPTRAPEIADAVARAIADAGYVRVRVTPRTEPQPSSRHTKLVLTVDPGPRATVGTVAIQGDTGMSQAELLSELAIRTGLPFDRDRLNRRIERYVDERKRKGYLQNRLSIRETAVDDHTVNLTISAQQGPLVKVVFNGDPIPADRRDDLVPIEAEGSADEDLLEDATRRIEEYFQNQGYRDAAAPHTREDNGRELVVTFNVRKGPQYRVEALDIQGNASIPADDIIGHLRVRAGQPFFAAALDGDLSQIEDLYRRRGFTAARADASTSMRPPAPDQHVPVAIRIDITENTKTVVNSVSFDGNVSVPDRDLRSAIRFGPGEAFSVAQMALDRDAIELQYANRGFQHVSVETRPGITPDAREANVVFVIREGIQVFVDHVLVVGNARTKTETIERELRFRSGDPLGLDAISESQRRLAGMGLFRRVRITQLGRDEDTHRDVLVTVEEAPLTTVAYGGGLEVKPRTVLEGDVATETLDVAPRASFEIGRRNLFGTNRSVNLFTSAALHPPKTTTQTTATGLTTETTFSAFPEYRVLGQLRQPRIGGTAMDLRLTGDFEQQLRSSFNFSRRSFAAELGIRLPRRFSVIGGYQIQRTRVFDELIDPSEQLSVDRLFPKVRISSFYASMVHDTRDDPVDPSRGEYFSGNGQLAGQAIGSEVGFVKSFFTAQAFRPLPRARAIVAALSARFGAANVFSGVGGTEDLPASERFFAGGDTTARGFALDRLGVQHVPPTPSDTLDPSGLPLGGNALVLFNGELRVPFRSNLKVVGFADVGNVFKTLSDVSVGELRPSLGFGFRYRSPVGPLRFDLGFKVPHRYDESRSEWFITFGEAF
jgi:outer membrane protein insertion porin family